jgi:hypothetical protein
MKEKWYKNGLILPSSRIVRGIPIHDTCSLSKSLYRDINEQF